VLFVACYLWLDNSRSVRCPRLRVKHSNALPPERLYAIQSAIGNRQSKIEAKQ